MLMIVVILPIGLIVLVCTDLMAAQFTAALMIGQVGVRKTYRLSAHVDPKINAFLILEKARTGKSISELVETIFREYQKQRDDKGPRHHNCEVDEHQGEPVIG
jgi:hypothetical protein